MAVLSVLLVAACDTTMPPGGTTPGGGLAAGAVRYSCGDLAFDPALLDAPGGAEIGPDPISAVLRNHLEAGGPDTAILPRSGWILVGATQSHAELVARTPAGGLAAVSLDQTGGAWEVAGWGECIPTAVVEGRSLATWVLDPAAELPGPADSSFEARVTERDCTGGQAMGDRLLPPAIAYGATTIDVIFTAVPLEGGHDCPGNPSATVTVHLKEPLGERVLRDAAYFPPVNANAFLR